MQPTFFGKTKSYGIILNSPINRTQNKSHTEITEGLARRPAGESQITEIIARRPVLAAHSRPGVAYPLPFPTPI